MKRVYEGMFLTDAGRARDDADGVLNELKGLIERFGGEIINLEKWEERKLTYEMRLNETRHKRAVFYLSHFSMDTGSVSRLERTLELSPLVIRFQILRDTDGIKVLRPKDYEEAARAQEDSMEGFADIPVPVGAMGGGEN